jgi:hypothetical protein
MHQTAAHGTSVRRLRRAARSRGTRRSGVVALVVATLGVFSAVLSPGAGASPLSPHAGPGQRATPAVSNCRTYGSDKRGWWSSCFPKLNMAIDWNGFNGEGQDIGSEVGTQATDLTVFKNTILVETEQSSALHDRDLIQSTLSDPDCGAEATPSYDSHGDGLLEHNLFTDDFEAWVDGVPTKNADWGPNQGPFPVSLPNCDGGNIPVSYDPGTPLAGDKCPADPRKDPLIDLYYGKHSQSGSLAKGIHDTWNFNCTFTPSQSWKSSGKFTMTENPCPRITKGRDLDPLRSSTKQALSRLYRRLEQMGGCFRFRLGWTDRHTHAQNADIVAGFRPMGLEAFVKTEPLRQYIVPVMHSLAVAAGLCGPTREDPVHYQTPYKTGKEKKPSCHLG